MKIFYYLLLLLILPFFSLAQPSQVRPTDACTLALNNGFESPVIPANTLLMANASTVPNWFTTATDNIIEIWSTGFQGVLAFEGNQFAELNANQVSTLIKRFTVQAGVTLTLSFAHRGRQGVDVMSVSVGPMGGLFTNLGNFSDGNNAWGFYQIPYTPLSSGTFELRFISVSAAGGNPTIGNFLDGVNPGSPSILSIISPPPSFQCSNVTLDGSASTSGANIVYAWTTTNGLIVGSSNNSSVTAGSAGTYTLTVTNISLGCSHSSSVTLAPNPIVANAGPNQTFCGSTTTAIMAANNPANNGIWALVSGAGNITTPANPNTTITGLAVGNNVFSWTVPSGPCASSSLVTIQLTAVAISTFATLPPICSGSSSPILPTVSSNGITGTWAPSTVSNTINGTYIFTPQAGQCALGTNLTQTIANGITPTFAVFPAICDGSTAPILPTVSTNGIIGTWLPATVSNTITDTYSFTPQAGQCALSTNFTQTIVPTITASFAALPPICSGSISPILPTISTNNIIGTWSPATVNNTTTGTYIFTPQPGQCAFGTNLTQTITTGITPTFAAFPAICSGSVAPILPTVSSNGIIGTWLPTTISTSTTGNYTFTPQQGQCALATTITQTIVPTITASFATFAPICNGGVAPLLPAVSSNGITGTWVPTTVSNTATATYTFTPQPGQCTLGNTITQIVVPKVTPTFSNFPPICSGSLAPVLPAVSNNGISGVWFPATVSNSISFTYTFTPNQGACAVSSFSFRQIINPSPNVWAGNDTTVFENIPFKLHASGGLLYIWTLGSVYLNNIFAAEPIAIISAQQNFVVTVTNVFGCVATDDVLVKVFDGGNYFIPNTFTPNGDGLNDVFRAIPAGIATTEYFNIWNRWGQLIFSTKDLTKGWDGTLNGKKQPTGNYIWNIKGQSKASQIIELKGSIKLIR